MQRRKAYTVALCLVMSIAGLSMPAMYLISDMDGTDGGDYGYPYHQYPPMPLVPIRSEVEETSVYIPPTSTYRPSPLLNPPPAYEPCGTTEPIQPVGDVEPVVYGPVEDPSDSDTSGHIFPPPDVPGSDPFEEGPSDGDEKENTADEEEPPIEDGGQPLENDHGGLPLGDEGADLMDLKVLAQLEGAQDFSWTTHPTDRHAGQGQGCGNGGTQPGAQPGGIGSFEGDREVEEADIVQVEGEWMYLLNGYRGLYLFDVSEPSSPVVEATVPLLGRPVNMYVEDGVAYILVSYNYAYWYGYYYYLGYGYGQGAGQGTGQGQPSIGPDGEHPIGSKLIVVDVEDPTKPSTLLEMPIQGFVQDSRKVGDVLYYVSVCRGWYDQYTDAMTEDRTDIISLNIADIKNILLIDSISFEGASYQIYASPLHMYVADWDRTRGDRWGITTITLLDISDPSGLMAITDSFEVAGVVDDKYQMDEWKDTIRIVSHFRGNAQQSELWTFDISNICDVKKQGHLVIEDEGTLMATRFAGDRGYTIHLPPPPEPTARAQDPLDVLDLRDPTDPVLCDVFDMPGWVTHMEVRGMSIVAIGVDDTGGQRNVAVSLFDVTDPWSVVMEERVRFGGDWADSLAHSEPKALTVLDDLGILMVPYLSTFRGEDGRSQRESGVQLVSFDLDAKDLELLGSFVQPDAVLRTKNVEGWLYSTSNDYLLVTDISDLEEPKMEVSINLCPSVVDIHRYGGRYAELVVPTWGTNLTLRVFEEGTTDVMPPVWELDLGYISEARFWDGRMFHLVTRTQDEDGYVQFSVASYDLLGDTAAPRTLHALDVGHWSTIYYENHVPVDRSLLVAHWSSYMAFSDIGNPVMLDGGLIAICTGNRVWFVDVGPLTSLRPVTSIKIPYDEYYGLLPFQNGVYLVDYNNRVTAIEHEIVSFDETKLTPVSFYAIGGLTVDKPCRVPGIPMGVSSDGTRVYTLSLWYQENTGRWLDVLAVLDMTGGRATVAIAIDITDRDVRLAGDMAFITENVQDRYVNDDGYLEYTYETHLFSLDLASRSSSHWFFSGSYNICFAGDDLLILHETSSDDLTVIDFRKSLGVSVRIVRMGPDGHAVVRHGDTLEFAEGKYGIRTVPL